MLWSQKYLVHAANPENMDSIIGSGFIFPNSEFQEHKINTVMSVPYPGGTASERFHDPYVYFCKSIESCMPEISVNMHTCSDYESYVPFRNITPPLRILPVRIYFDRKTLTALHKGKIRKRSIELSIKEKVDLFRGLLGIIIPDTATSQISHISRISGHYSVLDTSSLPYDEYASKRSYNMAKFVESMNTCFLKMHHG